MCIINDPEMLKKEKAKTGRLMLWKLVYKNNCTGVWRETDIGGKYIEGVNIPKSYKDRELGQQVGQFHCFFSRESARQYKNHRVDKARLYWVDDRKIFKIIKVYAARKDIVKVGLDVNTKICCISVSKMEIKSLKHQR